MSRNRRPLVWFTCIAGMLASAHQAMAAAPLGWHSPGAVAAPSNATEGPGLVAAQPDAPKVTFVPAHSKPTKAEPVPELPPAAPASPDSAAAQIAADNWAEQVMATRARRLDQKSGVVPASHETPASHKAAADGEGIMAPSAFDGERPTPRAASGEELPAPTPTAPPAEVNENYVDGPPPPDFATDDGGGMPCDDCGQCGDCCCDSCCPCPTWYSNYYSRDLCYDCTGNWLENLTVFGGTQGFKGPVDFGRNGNFGYHYGLNWGAPLWQAARLGYQVGAQIVQSNFSGSDVFTPTSGSRTRYFVTAGIFERATFDSPWQWGVAWDWLNDQYYVNTQLSKIRGELSFVGSQGDEIGTWISVGTKDPTNDVPVLNQTRFYTFTPTDLYAFFYRKHFQGGPWVRMWAGFTGNRDGLLGGDFWVPVSPYLSLAAISNYLVPNQSGGSNGFRQESWAVSFNLVLHLGGTGFCSVTSPWRPLFGVSDNADFMVDRHLRP